MLDDGTLAGSTLTMERAFRTIVTTFGLSLVDAAMLCSTTPARELGLTGFGVLARDCVADVAVLDRGIWRGSNVYRRRGSVRRGRRKGAMITSSVPEAYLPQTS